EARATEHKSTPAQKRSLWPVASSAVLGPTHAAKRVEHLHMYRCILGAPPTPGRAPFDVLAVISMPLLVGIKGFKLLFEHFVSAPQFHTDRHAASAIRDSGTGDVAKAEALVEATGRIFGPHAETQAKLAASSLADQRAHKSLSQ